jgi:ABC-type multidrug transport system fused ATPase/permease subunit
MAVATVWFSDQARKAFRKTRLEMGSVNAELQESIAAVREEQAFNRAEENISNFRQTNAANRDANVRAVAFTSALAPALEALGYVALAIVVGVGGYYLLREQASWHHRVARVDHHLPELRAALQSADPADRCAVDQHPERGGRRRAHLRAAR